MTSIRLLPRSGGPMVLLLSLACTAASPPPGAPTDTDARATRETATPPGGDVVLRRAMLPGSRSPVDVLVTDGRIGVVGAVPDDVDAAVVDLTGRWIAPAFIDSHVHVAYLPRGAELRAGGVAAGVDLAMPLESIGADHGGLQVLASGPMITAVGGYPTQSWGRNGYGLEVTGAAEAAAAVDALVGAGARVIKVPVGGSAALPPDALAAVVTAAHERGVRVAAHALDEAAAATAAAAGVDVLAHTPTERLSTETVALWSDRAVVSSLVAFGTGGATLENLAALRAAGATVLYGTDFGNTRTASIQAAELRALADAGLDGAAILDAGTAAAATYWGLEDLGLLEPGRAASLLVLDADPHLDPVTLSRPVRVWMDGVPLE